MNDSRKTKKELLAEIRALRQQLETRQQNEAGVN